jgi:hypothetical protein
MKHRRCKEDENIVILLFAEPDPPITSSMSLHIA